MTPAEAIATLDAQLAEHGQDAQLRRTNTAVGQITVRAFVRGYKAEEVVGIISAGDTKIVISPTGLGAFGIPPANGFVVLDGSPRRIISATPFKLGGELVRVELQVRG